MSKVNLKSLLGVAALGMTLVANSVPTWAGTLNTPEVRIGSNQTFQYASGSMVGARYSADSTQFIGCFVHAQSDLQSPSIRCFARDSVGTNAFCISIDPRHVQELQGMTDSSYLYFDVLRPSVNCNRIVIYNGSENLQ